MAELIACVERGLLHPVVHREYPLEQLTAAQREVAAGTVLGKVVVRPWREETEVPSDADEPRSRGHPGA